LPLDPQKIAPWLRRSANNATSGWNVQGTKLTQASVTTKGIICFTTIPVFGDTAQMDAIFWIDTIQEADKSNTHQLQYSQTVLLNFNELSWPHVSVTMLTKQ
jgi:hypothetical protein